MKNITQRKFFIIYDILLLLAIEIFMILAINLTAENKSMITGIVTIFLSPFLGSMLVMTSIKKYIGEFIENNFNKVFLISNILIYLLGYVLVLKFNIVLLSTYTIGAVIGYLINTKIIAKIKVKNMKKENFFENEKKIKEYEFEKFNSKNIQQFLKINHMIGMKFLVANIRPIKKKYILWKRSIKLPTYMICFDDKYMYFFELIKKTKKYIEKGYLLEMDKIKVERAKEKFLEYALELEFGEGNIFNLYIPKMYLGLDVQKENSKEIFEKIINIHKNIGDEEEKNK